METKQLRENRKMRKATVATTTLLVVLAVTGFASAAVVELSIVLDNPTLLATESTTYTVYGVVTDNVTEAYGVSLNGGLVSFGIDQMYSGSGTIQHSRAASPPMVYTANPIIQEPFTALTGKGSLSPSGDPLTAGTVGVIKSAGASSLPGDKFDYYTDAAPYQVGNGTPVALFSGSVTAIADGTVTIDAMVNGSNILVWEIDDAGLKAVAPETIIAGSATLTIGDVVDNEVPTVAIPGGDVLEEDWSDEDGWTNLDHSVIVAAVGDDADGDPLTYQWTMMAPGGQTEVLGETGDTLNLTLAELDALGFTLPAQGAGAGDPGRHAAFPNAERTDPEFDAGIDDLKRIMDGFDQQMNIITPPIFNI